MSDRCGSYLWEPTPVLRTGVPFTNHRCSFFNGSTAEHTYSAILGTPIEVNGQSHARTASMEETVYGCVCKMIVHQTIVCSTFNLLLSNMYGHVKSKNRKSLVTMAGLGVQ